LGKKQIVKSRRKCEETVAILRILWIDAKSKL
jgi:hypothetical protein